MPHIQLSVLQLETAQGHLQALSCAAAFTSRMSEDLHGTAPTTQHRPIIFQHHISHTRGRAEEAKAREGVEVFHLGLY